MNKTYQGLFLLFLALFALGQLQRIQLTPTVGFHLHDILIFAWVTLSLLTHPQQWRSSIRKFKLSENKLEAVFVGWVILTLLISSFISIPMAAPFLYLARVVMYCLFAYSLPFTLSLTSRKHRQLWTYAGLLIGWLGIVQYVVLPDTRFLRMLGWDDHYYRLISTQFDPGFAGILLAITINYLWSLKHLPTKLKLVITTVLSITIALTFSRASYLSAIFGSLIIVAPKALRKSLIIVSAVLITFVLLYLTIPKPGGEGVNLLRWYSISQRIGSNTQALSSLQPQHWLIGRGLFVSTKESASDLPQHAAFPDNLFVFVLTGVGIPGLIMFTVLLYKWLAFLYKKDRYLFASWIAVLIHSQFNHSLFQSFVLLMLLGGIASLDTKRNR
jgi:hypothetical protein